MRIARIFASAGAAGLLLLAGAPSPAPAASADPRLAAVETFAFAGGSGTLEGDLSARYAGYDLIVADGQEATAAQAAALRSGGAVVLAYLSAGTIEPYRPWYKRLRRYRLPDRFEEWDEDYARVNSSGFRRQLAKRIAPRMLRKGFDGLFLDNTDMIETHRAQRKGMRKLVAALSRTVDRVPGRYLFTQNGASSLRSTLRFYDGWNREDVSWTYDFGSRSYEPVRPAHAGAARAELARIGAAGLLTTATDYTAAGDAAAAQASLAAACAAGAVPFVTDIGLTRIPVPPLRCP
jgi:hypothetical protein